MNSGATGAAAGRKTDHTVMRYQTAQADVERAALVWLPRGLADSKCSAGGEQAAAAAQAGSTATGARWKEEGARVAVAVGFGSLHSNRSALEALVCPDYALVRFLKSSYADPMECLGCPSGVGGDMLHMQLPLAAELCNL